MIPVLYEDAWLLVLNKPSGILSIPAFKKEKHTLTDILNKELEKRGEFSYKLHPCHRLDKDTSGAIIYAKGKSMQKKMMQAFKDKKIKKRYIAFVQGRVSPPQGVINKYINGVSAITKYKVILQRKDFSVLEIEPYTGRTNQIRLHLKAIGHPVIGEDKFAFKKDYTLRSNRLCLHAKAIEFKHPITGKDIHIEAPLPISLKNFLKKKCLNMSF